MTNRMQRITRTLLLVGALLGFASGPPTASAFDLEFWEASSSPGVPLAIVPPAIDMPLDVDYSPSSAEGGGLYGMSEILVVTTGDLVLTTTGFSCQTFGCLFSPTPFVGGTFVRISGADNLPGEFGALQDLLSLSVSGTIGHVVLASGHYLDAGGVAQSIGNIQDIDAIVLATVPEPGFGAGLLIGAIAIVARTRRLSHSKSQRSLRSARLAASYPT